jgi:hypothetical protein
MRPGLAGLGRPGALGGAGLAQAGLGRTARRGAAPSPGVDHGHRFCDLVPECPAVAVFAKAVNDRPVPGLRSWGWIAYLVGSGLFQLIGCSPYARNRNYRLSDSDL